MGIHTDTFTITTPSTTTASSSPFLIPEMITPS